MKKRENIVIIVILVLMLVAIIGVSYAAFSFSGIGNTPNTITTGSITMTYTESDNKISLNGALPTTDETGMVRLNLGEYFDFSVSSAITGDVNINYEISAKEVGDGTIDGSNIKLYLTRLTDDGEEQLMSPETYNEEITENIYTGRPSGEMSLYTSSMNSSESNNYRLRMYVDEGYNPQGDGGNLTFTVQINVYGRDRAIEPVSDVLLANIPEENQYDDGVDTFITGEDPDNYIWYSGKLWRAVSVNNEVKTVKLVTQWNISTINFSSGSSIFEESYVEEWLNDTSIDGFLYNLRDPERFIVMDAKWDATEDSRELGNITRPTGTTIVTDAVGLLNMYEYQTSYRGTDYTDGYLSNGLYWWSLTPFSPSQVCNIGDDGSAYSNTASNYSRGIRPSVNLKSSVQVVDGNGTKNNPYRLEGDNDTDLSGTLLSSRYSGEYIRFGTGENNLYRIVSHENETGTKIVSAEPLKKNGTFITMDFGNDIIFSSTNTIGAFLNGEYLKNYVNSSYSEMIENNTTWYLGTVRNGDSYKLAKYMDENGETVTSSVTDTKVGLLRFGELMAGQFNEYSNNIEYWTLTPYSSFHVYNIYSKGGAFNGNSSSTRLYGIKPVLNLKSNVIITGGEGTKNNPFTLKLAN